jgi:hypothetical protein
MTIAEIRQIEENRQSPDQYGVIHLLKEVSGGKEFYRAHDWSAWIMSVYPIGKAVEEPMKVNAKKLKDGYIEVWVGFPAGSLGMYVPDSGTVLFEHVSDNQIDVTIQLPEGVLNTEYETLRNAVDDWKAQQPLNDGKKSRREAQEVAELAPRVTRISDAFRAVLSFPLESKSPIEAWEFMRQLRHQIAAMF